MYNGKTIRFFDTPFKDDSLELSPRNKRENSFSATSPIPQLSWLPFVGQQLAPTSTSATNSSATSAATVQLRCFPTKCFLLRFFYLLYEGGPLNKEQREERGKSGKTLQLGLFIGVEKGRGREESRVCVG